jgi:hypothetical protein
MRYRQGEPRVVISVSGGVAEENTVLAVGPVHVYIVDFDDLKESDAEKKAKILAGFPSDVRSWVEEELAG